MPIVKVKGSVWDTSDNIVVTYIADLASAEKEGVICVLHGSVEGDNQGGYFYWDGSEDKANADGALIIDADGTGTGLGCWIRVFGPQNYSLAWFGQDSTSTSQLLAEYGTDGAIVTITSSDGGTFYFDSTKVGEHDGSVNFNGWIRTGILSSKVEEGVTLSAGQVDVTFTDINPHLGVFFIIGADVDQGRLYVGEDYTIVNDDSITLAESYPAGTVILGVALVVDGLTEITSNFVNIGGDTMTGHLNVPLTDGSTPDIAVVRKEYVDSRTTIATQAEAEVGTDNTKIMSPLRVAQYSAANPFGLAVEPRTLLANYTDPQNPTAQEELDYAIAQKVAEIEKEFFTRSNNDGLCFNLKAAKALQLVAAPVNPATVESIRFYTNISAAEIGITSLQAMTTLNDVLAFNAQTDVSWG